MSANRRTNSFPSLLLVGAKDPNGPALRGRQTHPSGNKVHGLTRSLLRVASGCALVAALAACTSVEAPATSPTSGVAAPAAASCPADTGDSGGTSAATSDTATNYLALGDALTVDYQPGHGEDRTGGFVGAVLQDWRCRHPTAQLTNLGCVEETTSGAVTGAASGCRHPEGSQLAAALATLRNGGAGLVTVALGLQDASRCTHGAEIDPACVADLLSTVEKNMTFMLTQLRAAAPAARIVVLNLYNPLLANAGDPDAATTQPPQPASPQQATQSSDMFARLNRTLATVAANTGARVADVSGAFAATDTTGNAVPVNVQRLCDWTWQCRTGQAIPNDAGYAAMARTVIAAL
jgi:lysophospholipase L1-like esterase